MADLSQRIIYEDNHLIVVNKQAGELVQGDKTGDTPLLDSIKALIKVRDQKPGDVYLGAPHRLDRPVSGVVIFAKTSKALSRMSEIFRKKAIQKTYWAIVENAPQNPEGRLVGWMRKNEKQNKSYVQTKEAEGFKEAILNYKLRASGDRYHLIEVNLETGRHHQIRAQLADMGCIIKGDLKYGASRSNPDASISLHSRHTTFEHPVKKELIVLKASCPDDKLWKFFENQLQ